MRRRITDLFKKLINDVKNIVKRPNETKIPNIQVREFQPERKKPPSKWVLSHNMIQAKNANKLRKRRKKNKVAKKSRKINYQKAA